MHRYHLRAVIRCFALLPVFLLLLPSVVPAKVLEAVGPGRVDWTAQRLEATGRSSAWSYTGDNATARIDPAVLQRGAAIQARRQLFEALKEVRVDRQWRVGDLLKQRPQLRETLSGRVHSPALADGARDDTRQSVRLTLTGTLLETLMPPKTHFNGQAAAASEGSNGTAEYTGVVIDARNIALEPALFPRIYDDRGELIYGPAAVRAQAARQSGLAVYVRSMAAGLAHPRAGQRPVVLEAFSAQGRLGTDAVVLHQNEQLDQLASALRHARVIIVLGNTDSQGQNTAAQTGAGNGSEKGQSEVQEFELQ
ncbi:hypothetical protein [Desulfohalobium retbaense]|uniref:Uncharacterized protein n=1 Tax=Desulfohalobium retbaense (strain ATCC 49708 / DSM 5692 / JCM 16813 / HR100) TaxID=485915 RepID=C8X3G0_DESRD|nr:hypothetical protein [Desulfohalobium retbaense]ACV68957.1 hypothetical protein Dret_1673 [Desulfohalobium retbaense DSM 5692]